jgi:rhamnogalacturonyl hydrolase YesR
MLKAATAPELANETGLYYDEKGNQRKASRLAHDEQLQKDLWARSAEWVGLPA